ncbi:MAG: hypothetical protein GMKNLPBB_00541 [Myxococcota bacterium]|nr:hypothetical protein [Myxococcota bacterium]
MRDQLSAIVLEFEHLPVLISFSAALIIAAGAAVLAANHVWSWRKEGRAIIFLYPLTVFISVAILCFAATLMTLRAFYRPGAANLEMYSIEVRR